MTFNPDDFVFTDIPVPEENPTLQMVAIRFLIFNNWSAYQ